MLEQYRDVLFDAIQPFPGERPEEQDGETNSTRCVVASGRERRANRSGARAS